MLAGIALALVGCSRNDEKISGTGNVQEDASSPNVQQAPENSLSRRNVCSKPRRKAPIRTKAKTPQALVNKVFGSQNAIAQTHPDDLETMVHRVEGLGRAGQTEQAAIESARAIYGLTVASEAAIEIEPVELQQKHIPLLASLLETVVRGDPGLARRVFEAIPEDFGSALIEEQASRVVGNPDAAVEWIESLPDHDIADMAKWNLIQALHAQHGMKGGYERYPKQLLKNSSDIRQVEQRFGVLKARDASSEL